MAGQDQEQARGLLERMVAHERLPADQVEPVLQRWRESSCPHLAQFLVRERLLAAGDLVALLRDRPEREPSTVAQDSAPPRESAQPERVGPYLIEGRLGRGGMGVVYLGRHERLDRLAAVKVLPGRAGAALQERLAVEARAMARFAHPHMVTVYEMDAAGDPPYMALEYVPGESLAERLEHEGPLEPERAVELLLPVADALSAAHAAGILHRDVKPSNILIREPEGAALLADFGLARIEADLARLTGTGQMLGSPHYMPPEALSEPAHFDERSDIYSFGATLYQALAGTTLYRLDSSQALIAAILRGRPRPLREVRPAVPAELAVICHQCLARDPERRYETAAGLAADLRRQQEGRPVAALRTLQRGRQARRIGVAVVLALTGVLLAGLLREGRRPAPVERAPRPKPPSPLALLLPPAPEGDTLRERFRAWAVAQGGDEQPALLGLANLLAAREQLDLAAELYARALRDRPGDARALRGLGLALAARLRLPSARRLLAEAEGDEVRFWRQLASQLSPVLTLRLPGTPRLAADLDGQPGEELLLLEPGGALVAGRIAGGAWQELARLQPPEQRRFVGAGVLDLDGDGKPEVLAAEADRPKQRGELWILRPRDGKLQPVARAPLGSTVGEHPFALLVAGGRRYLVVGTSAYDRALRFYRVDAAPLRLALVARVPAGGDVFALATIAPRNGRPALVRALVGPWSAYCLLTLRFDPARGKIETAERTLFAGTYAVDPRGLHGSELLVAGRWSPEQSRPMITLRGRRAFEREYKPPGLYRIAGWRAHGPARVEPVGAGRWGDPPGVQAVTGLALPGLRLFWAGGARRVRLYRGPDLRRVATLLPEHPGYLAPLVADLDGDGDDELLAAAGNGEWALHGMGPAPEPPPLDQVMAGLGLAARGAPGQAERLLDVARLAEKLELYAEAEAAFAAAGPSLEAVRGRMRLVCRRADAGEVARTAWSLASAGPAAARAAGGIALDRLEQQGDWPGAVTLIGRLLGLPAIDPDWRRDLRRRRDALARLQAPRTVWESSAADRDWDLLASSPFALRRTASGWVVDDAGAGGERLLVPLTLPAGADYRLSAVWSSPRQEWLAGCRIGLVRDTAATAGHRLALSAGGEATNPRFGWTLLSSAGAAEVAPDLPIVALPLETALRCVPHRGELRARLTRKGLAPRIASVTARAAGGELYLLVSPGNPGAWRSTGIGSFVLDRLRLESGSPGCAVRRFIPRDAQDHLLLAGGRWIQGRRKEALELYRRAEHLAVAEDALAAARRRVGAPADSGARLLAVKARFWRALLDGDRDALTAVCRDLPRTFARLLRRAGPGLPAEPAACSLLAAVLAKHGAPAEAGKLAPWLLERFGEPAAVAVLSSRGYRLLRVIRLAAAPPGSTLAKGDRILSYDRQPVYSTGHLRLLQARAREERRRRVELEIERGGQRRRLQLDPAATWLEAEAGYTLSKQ